MKENTEDRDQLFVLGFWLLVLPAGFALYLGSTTPFVITLAFGPFAGLMLLLTWALKPKNLTPTEKRAIRRIEAAETADIPCTYIHHPNHKVRCEAANRLGVLRKGGAFCVNRQKSQESDRRAQNVMNSTLETLCLDVPPVAGLLGVRLHQSEAQVRKAFEAAGYKWTFGKEEPPPYPEMSSTPIRWMKVEGLTFVAGFAFDAQGLKSIEVYLNLAFDEVWFMKALTEVLSGEDTEDAQKLRRDPSWRRVRRLLQLPLEDFGDPDAATKYTSIWGNKGCHLGFLVEDGLAVVALDRPYEGKLNDSELQ